MNSSSREELDDETNEGESEEKDCDNNCCIMKDFIDTAFGGVDITGATKNPTESSAFLLNEDQNNDDNCQNELDNVEDSFLHIKVFLEI